VSQINSIVVTIQNVNAFHRYFVGTWFQWKPFKLQMMTSVSIGNIAIKTGAKVYRDKTSQKKPCMVAGNLSLFDVENK
jgi:hypothetical protein